MTMPQPRDLSFRRSVDGFLTVFSNLKRQRAGEVDNTLYNIGILTILAAFAGVFLVLWPFLNPLLWALLFGAVLFPAKKRLSYTINAWIGKIEKKETPIAIGLMTLPFDALVKLGECIAREFLVHMKILMIGLGSIILLRIIACYAPTELFSAILNFIVKLHTLFGAIAGSISAVSFFILIATYFIAVFILWKPSNARIFTMLGQGIWVFILAYLCNFLGSLQIPTFICVLTYGLIGVVYDEESQLFKEIKSYIYGEIKEDQPAESEEPYELAPPVNLENTPMGKLMKTKHHLSEIKQKMQLNLQPDEKSSQKKSKEVELESDKYFKLLFYSCIATLLWNQMWIFFLCFIPISMYALNELCKILGFGSYIEAQWRSQYASLMETWLEPRKNALIPVCMPGMIQLNLRVHKFSCEKLKSFVDDISACVMILFLVICAIVLSIFFFFQIYSETIAVAQLSSDLVNRTLTHRPDLVEMLPINMQSMNDVIDNAYKYSRGMIEDYLDKMFNETNPDQSRKLKVQILSVWDRIIQSYMDRNSEGIGPRVPTDSVMTTLDEIVTTSGVTLTGLFSWAQSNVGMLMEVSDSLWIVLKANLTILFSATTSLFSVVLFSGHAMFKFLFNTIIFFTTLYYLLQSSGDRYAPIALGVNSAWGHRLTDALEDSVSSVLVATMKLSLFHGLFTWLTHTLFGVHVIYLPAILASVLAAAPFLEVYWCCLPAFLDLWLSQDCFYKGIILVVIHFIIPTNFNPIIHSEIKGGGHPYLTALSIVGGMYLFGGVEGAILGPLLLCLLIVLTTVTMKGLNTPPNTLSSVDLSNSIATPTP